MSEQQQPPAILTGDQVGFFRVAGLVRQLLYILVPALAIQAAFLRYVVKDQVREAIDSLRVEIVTQKEWTVTRDDGQKKHALMDAATADLREQMHALEARIRSLELDEARAAAAATRR